MRTADGRLPKPQSPERVVGLAVGVLPALGRGGRLGSGVWVAMEKPSRARVVRGNGNARRCHGTRTTPPQYRNVPYARIRPQMQMSYMCRYIIHAAYTQARVRHTPMLNIHASCMLNTRTHGCRLRASHTRAYTRAVFSWSRVCTSRARAVATALYVHIYVHALHTCVCARANAPPCVHMHTDAHVRAHAGTRTDARAHAVFTRMYACRRVTRADTHVCAVHTWCAPVLHAHV